MYPIQEITQMSEAAFTSRMFPVANVEQMMTLMMLADAEGKHPIQAVMQYDVIQGKPRLKTTEMQSRFQQCGGRIKWLKRSPTECTLKLSHELGGELEVTWDIERAKAAGLANKDNWKKYPTEMLAARCVSEGIRAVYPACLGGFYSPEEFGEISGQSVNVQPEAEVVEAEVVEAKNQEEAKPLEGTVSDSVDVEHLKGKIAELAGQIQDPAKRDRAFAWLEKQHASQDYVTMCKRCHEILSNEKTKEA